MRASEEALSSNEELQSTNEELETAKEELQSSNEELITLNEELRHRNSELSVLSNDLNNLLVGVNLPVLVLDGSLRIRRFTPVAGKLLNLIESDVGRPFSDIASTFSQPGWTGWFSEVIEHVRAIEREVQDRQGFWHLVRIRPYRTSDNKIDGVIVVILDIDLIKRPLLEEVQGSQDYAALLLESSGQAVVASGADERVALTNSWTERMFGYQRQEIVGQPAWLLFPEDVRRSRGERIRAAFATPGQQPLRFTLEGRRKDGARFPVEIGLSIVERMGRPLAVEFVTDVSERRQLENLSEGYRLEVGALAAQLITAQEEERRRVSRDLHDGICQHLASLALEVEKLAAAPGTPPATRSRLRALKTRAVKASEEARHIAYELHPSVLDDLGLVVSLRELCDQFSKAQKLPLVFTAAKAPDAVPQEVAAGLYRIAQESLQNIAKHANAGHVWVELAGSHHHVSLSIQDDGIGFDTLAVQGKGGLGIVNMSERTRMLGGTLSIESRPGQGARIVALVPLPEAEA